MTNLLFMAGSQRTGSLNKRLAHAAMVIADDLGANTTFVDLKDFQLPLYDGDCEQEQGVPEAATKLAEIVRSQDGVFIACPEYNSSITPLLKNTLDWLSRLRTEDTPPRTPLHGRVFAIGATSMGPMGGVRGLQNMSALLINGYQVQVLPQTIAVGAGHQVLSDEGTITDPQKEAMMMGVVKGLIETAGSSSACQKD